MNLKTVLTTPGVFSTKTVDISSTTLKSGKSSLNTEEQFNVMEKARKEINITSKSVLVHPIGSNSNNNQLKETLCSDLYNKQTNNTHVHIRDNSNQNNYSYSRYIDSEKRFLLYLVCLNKYLEFLENKSMWIAEGLSPEDIPPSVILARKRELFPSKRGVSEICNETDCGFMYHMESDQLAVDPIRGSVFEATGRVFVCPTHCVVHVCDENCVMYRRTSHRESFACPMSGLVIATIIDSNVSFYNSNQEEDNEPKCFSNDDSSRNNNKDKSNGYKKSVYDFGCGKGGTGDEDEDIDNMIYGDEEAMEYNSDSEDGILFNREYSNEDCSNNYYGEFVSQSNMIDSPRSFDANNFTRSDLIASAQDINDAFCGIFGYNLRERRTFSLANEEKRFDSTQQGIMANNNNANATTISINSIGIADTNNKSTSSSAKLKRTNKRSKLNKSGAYNWYSEIKKAESEYYNNEHSSCQSYGNTAVVIEERSSNMSALDIMKSSGSPVLYKLGRRNTISPTKTNTTTINTTTDNVKAPNSPIGIEIGKFIGMDTDNISKELGRGIEEGEGKQKREGVSVESSDTPTGAVKKEYKVNDIGSCIKREREEKVTDKEGTKNINSVSKSIGNINKTNKNDNIIATTVKDQEKHLYKQILSVCTFLMSRDYIEGYIEAVLIEMEPSVARIARKIIYEADKLPDRSSFTVSAGVDRWYSKIEKIYALYKAPHADKETIEAYAEAVLLQWLVIRSTSRMMYVRKQQQNRRLDNTGKKLALEGFFGSKTTPLAVHHHHRRHDDDLHIDEESEESEDNWESIYGIENVSTHTIANNDEDDEVNNETYPKLFNEDMSTSSDSGSNKEKNHINVNTRNNKRKRTSCESSSEFTEHQITSSEFISCIFAICYNFTMGLDVDIQRSSTNDLVELLPVSGVSEGMERSTIRVIPKLAGITLVPSDCISRRGPVRARALGNKNNGKTRGVGGGASKKKKGGKKRNNSGQLKGTSKRRKQPGREFINTKDGPVDSEASVKYMKFRTYLESPLVASISNMSNIKLLRSCYSSLIDDASTYSNLKDQIAKLPTILIPYISQ